MARLSIDDQLGRDTRVDRLALLCGWSRRETRACLQDVWALCYDRVVPYLPAEDIEITALRDAISPPAHPSGFVAALIETRLARPATAEDRSWKKPAKERAKSRRIRWKDQQWSDRVYIAGAPERISYLIEKREAASMGGLKSAESKRNSRKHQLSSADSNAQAAGYRSANPSSIPSASASADPIPNPLSIPSSEERAREGFEDRARSQSEARKAEGLSASEFETVQRVLAKLREHNGVEYTVNPAHQRLISERLREGYSREDLLMVVGFCAVEKGWAAKPEFRHNLAPEALFGADKITRYIDAARSWFRELEQADRRRA